MRWILALVFVLVAAPPVRASHTVPTGQHPPQLETQVDRWYLDAMEAIYQGRPSEANRLAAVMEQAVPEDPRPYLLQARILRLDVPDQNEDRGGIGATVGPMKDVLEKAIAASDKILEADKESLPGHLYRGWAYMFLAQMHALADEYWSAGRKAKAGKDDLDLALARDPGNADALLVQGVYLYFADILPATVKVARVFLRVPGGHRERGLEYMEAATERHGYTELDAKALLGVVNFAFEGRLEEAIRRFDVVLETYPDNVRMMEPLSVIWLYFPERLEAARKLVEAAVRLGSNSPEQLERKVASRLQYYLAIQEMLTGDMERARDRLALLKRSLPGDPDWLERAVMSLLVDLERMLGDDERAAEHVATLADRSPLRLALQRKLQEPGASAAEAQLLRELQPALRALYAGDLQAAETALGAPGLPPPCVDFYRGEIELLRQRPASALPHFEHLLGSEHAACWRWFHYFAYLRAAEAHAALGAKSDAAKALDKALDYREERDLLRHVTRARKRYYETPEGTAGAKRAAEAADSR